MRKLKRDDEVIVIAGKDKGKRGKIVKVTDNGSLLVSGVNMIKRHTKPNPNMGVAGGIVEREALIQASNIAILNPKTQKADRIGFREEDGKKVRFFKSDNELVDA